MVDLHPPTLLGRHVARRPYRRTAARPVDGKRLGAQQLGHAKIEDLGVDVALVVELQENVAWFQISVGDAGLMRGRDGMGNDMQDGQRLLDRQATSPLEIRVQRHPLQQLHHVVAAPIGHGAEREDVDDVAVPDLVDRTGFGHEPRRDPLIGRVLRVKDLDRSPLADNRMRGLVHCAKASLPDLADDQILPHLVAESQFTA